MHANHVDVGVVRVGFEEEKPSRVKDRGRRGGGAKFVGTSVDVLFHAVSILRPDRSDSLPGDVGSHCVMYKGVCFAQTRS